MAAQAVWPPAGGSFRVGKRLDETRVPWQAWVVPSHVVAWVLSEVGSWAPAVERKCGTKLWKESTV